MSRVNPLGRPANFIVGGQAGLGHSAMAQRYGIADLAEAKAYLADAVLGPRLAEITAAVAKQLQAGVTLTALLGDLDARKAGSSLTLFERAASGTPEGEPWIRSFLASAVSVLAAAEAQGLPRCHLTVTRLEVGPGLRSPQAPAHEG